MGDFLNSYKQKLEQANILFVDEIVLSAVEQQARGHKLENQQKCNNIDSKLKVRDVDDFGFVTSVRCTKCGQILDTRFNVGQEMDRFIDSYKNKLSERNISGFHNDKLKTVLAAVVVLKRRYKPTSGGSTLCRHDNADTLQVTDVDRYGLVTEVTCMTCDKSINPMCYVKRNTVNFLNSYQVKLTEKNMNVFLDEQRETVLSAVVVLLRRHDIDNQLCCHNDENMLEVTGVDRYGFVTEVTCTRCQKTMDTTCYNANWTKEIINDNETNKLNVGDHICWHRPCAIWHHAIVTQTDPSIQVIHYYDLKVKEGEFNQLNNKCCDSVYRINYEDCYNADYTVLRARKLLGENRYNLLERNCEHFSSWCKTGAIKSSQVSTFWTSLGRVAATICLRLIALVILFLIQLSHEASEQICQENLRVTNTVSTVRKTRCAYNEKVEKILSGVYIIIATIIFTIHLLITSGKRLAVDPRSMKTHDIENPGECCECYNDNCCVCCCVINTMYILVYRALCCLFCCTWRRHIKYSPFTCCRRPGKLACGLFWRIFLREVPGQIGTMIVVINEDEIGTARSFQHLPASNRTGHIIGWIILVQVVGYAAGIICGRLIEACFECCAKAKNKTAVNRNEHETSGIFYLGNFMSGGSS